jgi:ribonucleotide monophosphatase NagD (HAD superfamily)
MVLAGLDFTLTYDKLRYAAAPAHSRRLFRTNGDLTFPAEEETYRAGAILAAIQAATGFKLRYHWQTGTAYVRYRCSQNGQQSTRTAMIGDRL